MIEPPEGALPAPEHRPLHVFAVPEVHYPEALNVAVELVDRHVDEGRGGNVALKFLDERITYQDLQKHVNRLGNVLLDLGVEPGDRVLVRVTNRPEAVVACLALQKIGAIALPSMKLLRARELAYILSDAGITHAIVLDRLLEEVEKAREKVPALETILVVERNDLPHDHRSYDELLREASPHLDAFPTTRNDGALMLYTSGTTGEPKGAFHTHREVLATADAYARYALEPTEEDVFGGNPPLPFAYGYGCFVTFPLRFGASASLVEDPTPEGMFDAIEDHGITVLFSVPTAYNRMLAKLPEHRGADTSSLRLAVSAGEPLAPTTFHRFHDALGVRILDGIGTTEMLHIFISHRARDHVDPTATGFPVPGYECRVVDPETLEELPPGEPGLLAVRGCTGITLWNRPDAQAEAVHDGWSFPGDIYVRREDGRFVYKSRRDDLIITAGNNVAGPEVENVLEEHDAVAEVAVVGSPDPERGNVVKAFVVLAEGFEGGPELTAELQTHVKDRLAPYKYPREIEYVDELPRTETGKIRRVELRALERKRKGVPAED